jgi:hypothetical protein
MQPRAAAAPAPGSAPPTRVRELPPGEWQALMELPEDVRPPTMPDPGSARVEVLEREDTGEIVGYWFVFVALHVEPLWIDEGFRNLVGVIRRMWNGMRDILLGLGAKTAYGIISDDALVTVTQQARRIGFMKVPGALHMIEVHAASTGEEEPA